MNSSDQLVAKWQFSRITQQPVLMPRFTAVRAFSMLTLSPRVTWSNLSSFRRARARLMTSVMGSTKQEHILTFWVNKGEHKDLDNSFYSIPAWRRIPHCGRKSSDLKLSESASSHGWDIFVRCLWSINLTPTVPLYHVHKAKGLS